MKVLAIESSATAASAALMEPSRLLGQFFIHTRLTHSQTLIPMVEALLHTAEVSWDEIDALAVAAGPGSFTGVRIGLSSVKGMALTRNLPCVGVSALEAMAWPLRGMEGATICCAMDARRQQVYNALFKIEKGTPVRLMPDRALAISELTAELSSREDPSDLLLVGDGAELCYAEMKEALPSIRLSPLPLRIQSAAGVAMLAMQKIEKGETVSGDALMPSYLRLPQAERELRKKQETGKGQEK